MKLVLNLFVTGCVLCAASAVSVLRADERPKATRPANAPNVAVIYWQSFSRIPILTDEQKKMITEAATSVTAPVTDNLTEIINLYEGSLRILSRARNVAPCDWMLDDDSGPATLLLHVDKLRDLSRVALLRARQSFAAGATDEAVDDVFMAYKMGRDCGASPIVVSLFVSAAIEKSATDVLVAYLPLLKKGDLDQLLKALHELPDTCDVASTLHWDERNIIPWLIREVDAQDEMLDDPQAGRQLLINMDRDTGMNLAGGLNLTEGKVAVESLASLSVADVRESINRLRADYEELRTIAALRGNDRDDRFKQFNDLLSEAGKLKTHNDALRYFSIVFLSTSFTYEAMNAEEKWAVRLELLEQAIRIQRDDPDARQPIQMKKFEYRKTEFGFELQLPCGTGVEVLTVGRPL